MKLRDLALSLAGMLMCAYGALAQTAVMEGNVKGEDGRASREARPSRRLRTPREG